MPEQEKSKFSHTLPDKILAGKYKIIAGLGNPGKEFENTYHNVGIMALTVIALKWNGAVLPKFKSHKGLFEYAKIDNGVVTVKPLVFMNESGKAIAKAAREFGTKPEDIIIIHDDSDLTLGDFKISFGKNAGGHKGVQSTIDALQSKNFTRIRIGIRPKIETQRKKASAFVLANITKKDREILDGVFERIRETLSSPQ